MPPDRRPVKRSRTGWPRSLPPDLAGDRSISDRGVGGEQERPAKDGDQDTVVVEGEWHRGRLRVAGRIDAEVPVAGGHEDVPAAQVDAVGAHVPADVEVTVREGAPVRDRQSWQQPLQYLAADLGARAQLAKAEAVPVDATERAAAAPLQPAGVRADRRGGEEQVGVTHRLAE